MLFKRIVDRFIFGEQYNDVEFYIFDCIHCNDTAMTLQRVCRGNAASENNVLTQYENDKTVVKRYNFFSCHLWKWH